MTVLVGCGGNIAGGVIGWGQRAIFSGTISAPAAPRSVAGQPTTRTVSLPGTLQADLTKDAQGNVSGTIRAVSGNNSTSFDTGSVTGTVVNNQLNIICSGFTNLNAPPALGSPGNPASLQCQGVVSADQSQITNGTYIILNAGGAGGSFTLNTTQVINPAANLNLAGTTYSGHYNAASGGAGTLTITFTKAENAVGTDLDGTFTPTAQSGTAPPGGSFSASVIGSSLAFNVVSTPLANGVQSSVAGGVQATISGNTITGTEYDPTGNTVATFTLTQM